MRTTVHYYMIVALQWCIVAQLDQLQSSYAARLDQYIYMPSRVQLIQQVNGICVTGVVSHASLAPKGL